MIGVPEYHTKRKTLLDVHLLCWEIQILRFIKKAALFRARLWHEMTIAVPLSISVGPHTLESVGRFSKHGNRDEHASVCAVLHDHEDKQG